MQGEWGGCQQPTSPTPRVESISAAGGDCKALPGHQQLSQGALAQCQSQAPQGRSQACGKPKAGIKVLRVEQKEGKK